MMSNRTQKLGDALEKILKESLREKSESSKSPLQFKKQFKHKKGATSYLKLSEIRYISIGLASSQTIRRWAEKTLPNGKVLGLVTSPDTLHYKTFKPLKGGLFCERIFGPLRDFECACGIQKRPTAEEYHKIVQHQPLERKFCPTCDVEYTWSVIRRYQLGYIELVAPVGHVWYSRGQPNYLSILLDWKKADLNSFFYCTSSSTLEESLQIFNNPLLIDQGFKNPLFEFDWLDISKLTQTKSKFLKTSSKASHTGMNNFQTTETKKRLFSPVPHSEKIVCKFLKTKLHMFHALENNIKDGLVLEANSRICTKKPKVKLEYYQIYQVLLKKASKIVYEKAYILAHQRIQEKFYSLSKRQASFSPILLKKDFSDKQLLKQSKILKGFRAGLMSSTKSNKRKFPSQKILSQFKKMNVVNKKNLVKIFQSENHMLSKQSRFVKIVAKVHIENRAKANSFKSHKMSFRKVIIYCLRKQMALNLNNQKLFPIFCKSLNLKTQDILLPFVFHKKFIEELNQLSRIIAGVVVNKLACIVLKQYYTEFVQSDSKDNKVRFDSFNKTLLFQFLEKHLLNQQTIYTLQETLETEKILKKLVTTHNFYFLTQQLKIQTFDNLSQKFPFYKFRSTENMGRLFPKARKFLKYDELNLYSKKNLFKTLELNKTRNNFDNLDSKSNSSLNSKLSKGIRLPAFLPIKKNFFFHTVVLDSERQIEKNMKKQKLKQFVLKNCFSWKFGYLLATNGLKFAKGSSVENTDLLKNQTQALISRILSNQLSMTRSSKNNTEVKNACFKLKQTTKTIANKYFSSIVKSSNKLFFNKTFKLVGNKKDMFCMNTNLKCKNPLEKNSLLFSQMNTTLFLALNNKTSSQYVKVCKIFNSWFLQKLYNLNLNKKLLRSYYGNNVFSGQKPMFKNSIYLLSSREREFFYNEKKPAFFMNYCRGYSSFEDLWLPIYKYKGLDNNFMGFKGSDILQRFLLEFDDLQELSNMEKYYRITLNLLQQKIREFKILGSFFLSAEERRKLEKLVKKQVFFLRKTKLIRKLFLKKSKASSMLLTTLPVLPPDLRPILRMQNQVAASDLNRHYQRVLYRNDRLKKLQKTSGCLPTDLKYAQRLLQEAVDNLIQNGKSGVNPEVDSRGRHLKSLSELLKGKHGRFRQNLLGKRVDYSGRSVIVVGPTLQLHECGLPKEIAIELFLPFLVQRILHYAFARTVVGAKTLIKSNSNLCSFLLSEVMQSYPIFLNRAPTLHRLGIQAFQPKLIEGRAILLHPLVCPAFNADFDGDQMAVHLPLTTEARAEAWKLMFARNHLISAATGDPIMLPSQDMVLGCYYLTTDTLKQTQASSNLLNFEHFKCLNNESSMFFLKQGLSKNYTNELSIILRQFRPKEMSMHQKLNFTRYFQNFEKVVNAYQQQKLQVQSDIWVQCKNHVESFSPKSRMIKSSPVEIQVHPDGSWKEIRFKQIRHFTKSHVQMTQYIRTTPGRILFYNLIQDCIRNTT